MEILCCLKAWFICHRVCTEPSISVKGQGVWATSVQCLGPWTLGPSSALYRPALVNSMLDHWRYVLANSGSQPVMPSPRPLSGTVFYVITLTRLFSLPRHVREGPAYPAGSSVSHHLAFISGQNAFTLFSYFIG